MLAVRPLPDVYTTDRRDVPRGTTLSLRVAFDLDGVLADLGTAYDAVAAKVEATRATSSGRDTTTPGEAGDQSDTDDDDTATSSSVPVSSAETWEAIHAIPDFWTTLAPLEPGGIERIQATAIRHRWELFFFTQRPATRGDTVQRQTQRWLVEHGVDLPSVIVTRGSRGTLAAALHLDVLIDDTVQHCVDVIAESKTTPFLVLRKPDAATEGNAKRLGIRVVQSVAECLVVLEELQRRKDNPKLLDRLRQSIGAS